MEQLKDAKPSLYIRFMHNTLGATAIEYALIAGMVSILIVAALMGLSDSVRDLFESTATAIE